MPLPYRFIIVQFLSEVTIWVDLTQETSGALFNFIQRFTNVQRTLVNSFSIFSSRFSKPSTYLEVD